MGPIRVFSPLRSVRLNYVLNQIFIEWSDVGYVFVENVEDAQLIYDNGSLSKNHQLGIFNAGLLTDESPLKHPPFQFKGEDLLLFPTSDTHFWKGFDLFSAIFWMLSEPSQESQPGTVDSFGRKTFEGSFFQTNGIPPRVYVEDWVLQLFAELDVEPKHKAYTEISWDLDNLFFYRFKPLFRKVGLALKVVMKGDWRGVGFLLGLNQDPLEVYNWIRLVNREGKVGYRFFIPFGMRSTWDRNIPFWKYAGARNKVLEFVKWSQVGIHLSVQGHQAQGVHEAEIERFKQVFQELPGCNRFHYLKCNTPSLRSLEAMGIKEDHSWGFPDAMGFKSGVSWPFIWYDLECERISELRIFPFIAMDIQMRRSGDFQKEIYPKKTETLRGEHSQIRWVFHPDMLSNSLDWKGLEKEAKQLINWIIGSSH